MSYKDITRCVALVSASWDPLSRSETARLARLLAALRAEFPTLVALSASSVAGAPPAKLPVHWRELMFALLRRVRYSLEHDLFVPLYPKACASIVKLLCAIL